MQSITQLCARGLLISGLLIPTGIKAQSGIPDIDLPLANSIPLYAEITTGDSPLPAGESASITVTVHNGSAFTTATNPVITVALPADSTNIVSSDCVLSTALTLQCTLAEIAPDSSTSLTFTAAFENPIHNVLQATVSADQEILAVPWVNKDTDTLIIETTPGTVPEATQVDLSIEWIFPPDHEFVTNSFTLTELLVRNNHASITAHSPVVEIVTPEGWSIVSKSNNCTPVAESAESGALFRCLAMPLVPGAEQTIGLLLRPNRIDAEMTVEAAAQSTTQPDDNEQDNTARLDVTILPPQQFEILCGGGCPTHVVEQINGNNDENQQIDESGAVIDTVVEGNATDTENPFAAAMPASSGGGITALQFLFLQLAMLCFRHRKHRSG